ALLLTAAVPALRWYGAVRIRICDGVLVAGPIVLRGEHTGAVEILDEAAAFAWRTRLAGPRARLLIRTYLPRAVRVEVAEPSLLCPYVYLSTRRPTALADGPYDADGPEEPPPPPGPVPTAPTAPTAAGATGATGRALHPVPVGRLRATRRDDHLLIVWAWPPDGREARVRWTLDVPDPGGLPRAGDVRCGRRSYQHDGGLDLRVGRGAVTVTVEAFTPHPADPLAEPSALILPARPPLVRYEAVVRRGLRGRTARLTFVTDTACELPALQVVHGRGRICPAEAADGTVLRELPARRLDARIPFTVELPFPATRGTSWLVCLPLTRDDPAAELRPASLHRLKVS
ncbi:DUF3093 family protein, partial [Kitasatospora sp. NPDC001574]